MIAIILQEGWHNQAYIDEHVNGFEKIRPLFENFDAHAAVEVCELEYEEVVKVCHLFATRVSSHESDLGVLMSRHSTLVSYLENVLRTICGRIGVKGGNLFGMGIMSGGPAKVRDQERENQKRQEEVENLEAEYRSEYGGENVDGLYALIEKNHDRALALANVGETSKDANHRLASVWLKALIYKDQGEEDLLRSEYDRIIVMDPEAKSIEECERWIVLLMDDLAELRKN